MFKLLLTIFLFCAYIFNVPIFAEGSVTPGGTICNGSDCNTISQQETANKTAAIQQMDNMGQQAAGGSSSGPQKIITSEKVLGATCTCIAPGASTPAGQEGPSMGEAACGKLETRKYECIVPTGLTGFEKVFSEIVRTTVYIVMLLGVLAIVGLGIAWAWAGGDDVKMKSNLKHWAFNVVVGLIILFMFRYILTFLAPWIFQ